MFFVIEFLYKIESIGKLYVTIIKINKNLNSCNT